MAAITSRDPPKTRLSSREGSYSQIAVAFSTTAIFVMCFMTSTFPRLTTWPKQLNLMKLIRETKDMKQISMVVVVLSGTISEIHANREYFQ